MSDEEKEDVVYESPALHMVNSTNEKNQDVKMATLSHILGPLVGFLAPVLIFATYSEDNDFIKSHLRESLNASLTFLIASIIHAVLMMVCLGVLTFLIHWVFYLIWAISANNALKAGEEYQYPFTIRFVS
tara:strand:- start:685 stop:1074 length:390 start_codon:yes stop_codon:yes gene_type:complete